MLNSPSHNTMQMNYTDECMVTERATEKNKSPEKQY